MFSHPLITTLKTLKGNARGVVYTEPLWGIPYNLFAPYASVYMLSFGLQDRQIGLIASLGWASQLVFALLGGAITDKLGRKKTTLIFDILSWSVPCLIWAVAHNFTFFLIAALVNGSWRVSMTSWTCLLVEDTDPHLIVDIYSWIYIAGIAAAFFTPFSGLLVSYFSLVPTMRGLYLLGFLMMTTKFFTMNRYMVETRQGEVRMEETKNQLLRSMMTEYRGVFRQLLKTPQTLYTAGIMIVISICSMITNTFWSILVTQKLLVPDQYIAIFPFVRSMTMLAFFFLVMPVVKKMEFKKPMVAGFAGFIVSQLILILLPSRNYPLLLVSIFFEACSLAAVAPLVDRMVVETVEPSERARIMSLLFVLVILFTSPFGWIAGTLSGINRTLPFVLDIVLFVAGALLSYLASRHARRADKAAIVNV